MWQDDVITSDNCLSTKWYSVTGAEILSSTAFSHTSQTTKLRCVPTSTAFIFWSNSTILSRYKLQQLWNTHHSRHRPYMHHVRCSALTFPSNRWSTSPDTPCLPSTLISAARPLLRHLKEKVYLRVTKGQSEALQLQAPRLTFRLFFLLRTRIFLLLLVVAWPAIVARIHAVFLGVPTCALFSAHAQLLLILLRAPQCACALDRTRTR